MGQVRPVQNLLPTFEEYSIQAEFSGKVLSLEKLMLAAEERLPYLWRGTAWMSLTAVRGF